jgi:hypothetical protein
MSLTVERFDWVHSLRIPWAILSRDCLVKLSRLAHDRRQSENRDGFVRDTPPHVTPL